MYRDDPFLGLPTRLDTFGRQVVDESKLTPSQWIRWKQAEAALSSQEKPLQPWRGIATETLPNDIKKQLKPHWQHWIVANPEFARYRGSDGDARIFVLDRKGARQVRNLSEIQIGQQGYVLRRRRPLQAKSGGGVANSAPAPTQPDPFEEEAPPRRLSYVRIEHPINQSKFMAGRAPLQGSGPYTLKVDGTYGNGDGLTLHWENLDTGLRGKSGVESFPNRVGEPWKGEIGSLEQGSHRITIRNAQGDSHHIRIEIRPETILVAEILYGTGANTFHLLKEEDYTAFLEAAGEFDAVVRQLEQAHQSQSEDRLNTAKAKIDEKLKGLVNAGGESSLLTEVIGFRGKKFTYVRSEKMKNHLRSYKVDTDMKRRSLCGPSGKLDWQKLKEQFKKDSKTSFKWDLLKPHGGSFNEWAARFNQAATKILLPNDDPERHFDATAQAQLLRYAYGASLKGDFGFSDKTFGIKLEGGADFAVAEGKINCNHYMPKAEGHKVAFDYTIQNNSKGNIGLVKHFDLGDMRFRIEGSLYGFAGASCQATAGAYFEYKPCKGDANGKMQLRGSTKGDEGFAGAGGEAFVGAKVGGEITGNGEWKNPEKGKEWATLMSIGAEGDIAAGAGVEGKIYISYEKGKFRVRAKAGVVWGFGGSGGFVFSVNVDTIAEFCMFIYHQLKNNDFNYVDWLDEKAFKYYDVLSSYILLAGKPLEMAYRLGVEAYAMGTEAVEEGAEFLQEMRYAIRDALSNLENAKTRQKEAEALAERILANPDLVLFQPPEGKGRLLRNLCYEYWLALEEIQEMAMIAVLKTIQTRNEYIEVMEHLTNDGRRIKPKQIDGMDQTWELGEQTILEFLDGREKVQFLRLRKFMQGRKKLPRQPHIHSAAVRDNGIVMA